MRKITYLPDSFKDTYVITSLPIKQTFGTPVAELFGVYRTNALKKRNDFNKIYVQQKSIINLLKMSENKISPLNAILEEWKFIKIYRTKKQYIDHIQFLELNYQLFLKDPNNYKSMIDNGTMDFIFPEALIDKEDLKELNAKIQNLDIDNLSIDQIKEHLLFLSNPIKKDRLKNSLAYQKRYAVSTNDSLIKQEEEKPLLLEDDSQGAEGKKAKLVRRKTVQPKQSTRNKLKGDFAPPAKVNPKRAAIETIYNGKRFHQIKQLWNSLPGLRKIGNLIEGKDNKVLFNSVLATKALLTTALFKKGMIDYSGRKVIAELPKGFIVNEEEIDLHWFKEKIKVFHKIVTDNQLQPKNKDFLRKLSLADFILGANGRQERNTSVLFQYCCSDLKTVWIDPHEELTKKICSEYLLYTEQNKSFSGKDLQLFSKLSERITAFAKKPAVKESYFMGKGRTNIVAERFFIAQNQEWKGRILEMQPVYFAGDHAWSVFEKRLEY
jgi:hypothetical protein